MHEASERPDEEEQPGGDRVKLVDDGDADHGFGVWVEEDDASEPDGDGGAVVITAAERVSADRLGDSESDHQTEQ